MHRVADLCIPENAKAFLLSPGLPHEAAPFLTFGTNRDLPLPTVSEVWRQPKNFDRYRIIGSTGYGDPVCIDEAANGRVVYLNHDNEFLVGFVNSSVPHLAHSMLAFRDAVKRTQEINGADAFLNGQIPSSVVDEFFKRMDSIDPVGIKDGTFWFRSILNEGI